MRISTAGEVLFLNQAAQEQIFDLMVDHGSYIETNILEKMGELEDMEGRFNLAMGDKSYQIVVTPMQQSSELFLHFHDLTMEYSYQTLQSIWENVFDSTLEGFAVTDDQGIIEEINSSFSRITGYSKEEVIGLETKLLRSDRHDHQFFENMWNQLHEMGHWQGEVWNRKKDGEVYQEWLSISSFHNRQSDETKYVAIFHDITDIRQKEEELNHIIHHDILTDLPNRNSFYEELSTALHTRDSNTILAVIILDLDNFTMIYNYLGSALGDDFLQYLSEVFKSVTRVDDIVARLGSAEFAICIRSIENFVVCQRMINRLQDKLDNSVELAGHSLTPFINIGISLCPKDGDTPELLIRRARLAMQHGRQIRKGSHLYFEPSMEKNQLDRFDADISLKAALKNNEFVMEYQPLSSFIDGVIHGFEALIRWDRPSKGRISPTQFIPVLEENGMILEVGEWILKEVCQFISQLRMIDPFPFKIGVNISARQFASANFVDRLLYICETYKVPSHFIDLEITENIAALDLEGVIDTLSSLRKYGFSISIDDFGTGYSSLSYLKELPFDILKIDRSFIAPIEEKGTSLAIVRSVVTLAKSLGKKTVAEGVETKMQSRICREEGCDILQGFLYSVPLSIEDALDFVKIKSKDLKNLNQDS
ncbi:MAG: EAL domain-containing protein [Spirochaetaceae bacterium]|nr:EAL domain-containing protein [Spirochaetaceae bacterium]